MGVEARASSAAGRVYLPVLKREARAALNVLGLQAWELSLLLCDDAEIRRLNRYFRHKDRPTDVLSFPQNETDARGVERQSRARLSVATTIGKRAAVAAASLEASFRPLLLGDIVISIETAKRQADELGQSLHARLRTLMVHGILHLIGYDHERSPSEARRQFARERELAIALDDRLTASSRPRRQCSTPTIKRDSDAIGSVSRGRSRI
jgi:probable rRNA maturation factor